jgi:hypothetical protein
MIVDIDSHHYETACSICRSTISTRGPRRSRSLDQCPASPAA